jgi:hypothetical protein
MDKHRTDQSAEPLLVLNERREDDRTASSGRDQTPAIRHPDCRHRASWIAAEHRSGLFAAGAAVAADHVGDLQQSRAGRHGIHRHQVAGNSQLRR